MISLPRQGAGRAVATQIDLYVNGCFVFLAENLPTLSDCLGEIAVAVDGEQKYGEKAEGTVSVHGGFWYNYIGLCK